MTDMAKKIIDEYIKKEQLTAYLTNEGIEKFKTPDGKPLAKRYVMRRVNERAALLGVVGITPDDIDVYIKSLNPKKEEKEVKADSSTISALDLVMEAFKTTDYEMTLDGFVDSRGMEYDTDSVVFDIWNYLRVNHPGSGMDKSKIFDTLQRIESEEIINDLRDLRVKIAYDPAAVSPLHELLTIVCGPNYDPMYKLGFEHFIWNVKREVFGLDRWFQIMINFYGDAGAGKSSMIKAIFPMIFGKHLCAKLKNINEVTNDSRFLRILSRYVVVIDEMTGADKASVAGLKAQIDAEDYEQRNMGTNKFSNVKVKASFITSSNAPIRTVLITTETVRRWMEIKFIMPANNNKFLDEFIRPLLGCPEKGIPQKWNLLDIYRAIDETKDSPMKANDKLCNEFVRWTTARCISQTAPVEFLHEAYADIMKSIKSINNNGEYQVNPPPYLLSPDGVVDGHMMHSMYKRTHLYERNNSLGLSKFYELMRNYGFVDKKEYENSKLLFTVPSEPLIKMLI